MAKVVLENVTKRFGKVIAVNNVSLQAEDKEFLVLLGPSGCGKTTTLRMIAGLELVDEGKVIIGDDIVNDVPLPPATSPWCFRTTLCTLT